MNSSATLHPSIGLSASYAFVSSNDSVNLALHSVYNPRDASDLSGTLSLELWALPKAYDGGEFQGFPLAGVCIGCIAGQQNWANLAYDLPLSTPPSGAWIITLMLREWTGSGYTTRSHVNFPLYVTFPIATSAPAPAPKTPPPVKPKAPAPAPAPDPRLSLNHATAKELVALDGIGPALAKAIIAARPISKFEQLLKIKGVTAKLLAKIQPQLRID